MKRARRLAAIALALLLLYLGTAFAWAWVVAPRALALAERANPPVDVEALPADTVDVILRVEDPSFFRHSGVDPFTAGQGLTTITQALARMIFIEGDDLGGLQAIYRFVWQHAKKIDVGRDVMALALALRAPKQRQLALFLSSAYMGDTVGVPAAARRIFSKELATCSRREVMMLAAMLIGPNGYDPRKHPDANAERVRRIEKLVEGQCAATGLLDVTYEACR